MYFVGIARDNGTLDSAAGFTYAWTFGDGATGSSPIPSHAYASPGVYTVTLRVTGKNGVPITTTTKTTIISGAATPARDFDFLSTNLLSNTVYGNLQWKEMAASGAWGVNASWEQGKSSKWYIEQQRNGEQLILGGLLHNDLSAISAGFKAFDWGFQTQAPNTEWTSSTTVRWR